MIEGPGLDQAVQVSALGKQFHRKTVLSDVNFSLHAGEVVGLVGKNGAGKTTLLSLLSGSEQPTSGTIVFDPTSRSVHKTLRFLLRDNPAFTPTLTVWETLSLCASLSGQPMQREGASDIVHRCGLEGLMDTRVSSLSMGTRHRLNWGLATMLQPRVLLLDEPTAFLDPPGLVSLRQLIHGWAAMGCAILMSSHNLHEIVLACDRILLLADGNLRDIGNPNCFTTRELESKLFGSS